MKNKVTALVPMKGHSERVPNKNVRGFNGNPLLYWVINELNKSDHVEKIVVDTDSDKIIDLLKEYFSDEIMIINRPKYLCGDFVSMNKIIKYDIDHIKENDYFLQTHCTNPLLKHETIDEAISTFFDKLEKGFDSLFSVNRIQCRCYDHSGSPVNHGDGELERTQDLNPIYEENSNIFIFSRESFKNNNFNRIGCNPYLFEMEEIESIDIDEEKDFALAEKLHSIVR